MKKNRKHLPVSEKLTALRRHLLGVELKRGGHLLLDFRALHVKTYEKWVGLPTTVQAKITGLLEVSGV